jgi:pSer/pThr/pTyr-binding forkhead associated (FHA) protein
MPDTAILELLPENNSFSEKKIIQLSQPVIIGRATDGNDTGTATSIKFNSKVVSRMHARFIYQDGRVFNFYSALIKFAQYYVQDTKSSSGTYVNLKRLSEQGMESGFTELHNNDIIKLGEDYNQNGGTAFLAIG